MQQPGERPRRRRPRAEERPLQDTPALLGSRQADSVPSPLRWQQQQRWEQRPHALPPPPPAAVVAPDAAASPQSPQLSASARQPPWSRRALVLGLALAALALLGPGAMAWRLPGPFQGHERRWRRPVWRAGLREEGGGSSVSLAAAAPSSSSSSQPRGAGGGGVIGEGQAPATAPPTSTAAPPPAAEGGGGSSRRAQQRAPRRQSGTAKREPSPRSSGLKAGEEAALLSRLDEARRRKRRPELRALVRGLDLASLEATGSPAVLEALARAAGACQDGALAWDALQRLLARVEALEAADPGAAPWAPRWDTFSLVMSACRRRRDLDGLLRAFKAALPYGGHSTTVLLNILLAGLCDGGRVDVAAFYLEAAESKWGVQPNVISWNTLLSAASRAGQGKLLAELEARMAERGVAGDVTTRNIRLQRLLATRPLDEALAFWEELQAGQAAYLRDCLASGRAPLAEEAVMDLRTLNIVASHLARQQGFDEAAAAVDAARRRGVGVEPRAVTHNILLDALLKAGRVDEALEYFYDVAAQAAREEQEQGQEQGQGQGQGPLALVDSTTYDILLSGLVQNGRVSTAGVVHQMMVRAGMPPTIYTFAALVRLQKSASDVYRLWAQARAACGARLSLPFLNLLIHELGQVHGDLQGALAAFRAILRTPGLGRPNTISYNSLLAALVREAAAGPTPATASTNATATATVPDTLSAAAVAEAMAQDGDVDGDEVVVGETDLAAAAAAAAAAATAAPAAAVVDPMLLMETGRPMASLQQQPREALELLDSLSGKPVVEAALAVLRSLYGEAAPAKPNARSFTILLAGVGKTGLGARGTALAVALFREAEAQGVGVNGIMAHALLRAFGADAPGALALFKKELRVRLKALDKWEQEREKGPLQTPAAAAAAAAAGAADELDAGAGLGEGTGSSSGGGSLGSGSGHLFLAYLALLHVCGLADRADLALQSLYAMQRDGLRADRRAWDAYASGKDAAAAAGGAGPAAAAAAVAAAAAASASAAASAAPAPKTAAASSSLLTAPYESLLRAETLGWEGGETFFKRIRIRF